LTINKRVLNLAQGLSVPTINKQALSLAQGLSIESSTIDKRALSLAQGLSIPTLDKRDIKLARGLLDPTAHGKAPTLASRIDELAEATQPQTYINPFVIPISRLKYPPPRLLINLRGASFSMGGENDIDNSGPLPKPDDVPQGEPTWKDGAD
ncbi:hypothetical protein B296_00046022, partial [Ensete ventricosum]